MVLGTAGLNDLNLGLPTKNMRKEYRPHHRCIQCIVQNIFLYINTYLVNLLKSLITRTDGVGCPILINVGALIFSI